MSHILRSLSVIVLLGVGILACGSTGRSADEPSTDKMSTDEMSAGEPVGAVDTSSSASTADASKADKAAMGPALEVVEPNSDKDDIKPAKAPAHHTQKKPQPKKLTEAQTALRDRVRPTLAAIRQQPFNTRDHTVGEIIAFCQAFGCDTAITDIQSGQPVNGITCLCWNMPCGGTDALTLSEGHLAARIGYGYQAVPSQLAAVLAISRVPLTYPARSGRTVRTVADIIAYEKLTCRTGTDMSLKLIALSKYVTEPTWKNAQGEEWSLERIVKSELRRPVSNLPHGSTNRLLGLSFALEQVAHRGVPIEGEFLRAKHYVDESTDFVLRNQTTEGGWGRVSTQDMVMALDYTGHVLQWLVLTLPDNRLESPQIVRSVELVESLLNPQRYQWNAQTLSSREIGALTTAAHALAVYDQRIFVPADVATPAAPDAATTTASRADAPTETVGK